MIGPPVRPTPVAMLVTVPVYVSVADMVIVFAPSSGVIDILLPATRSILPSSLVTPSNDDSIVGWDDISLHGMDAVVVNNPPVVVLTYKLAVNPLTVNPVNTGLSPVPNPNDVLAVLPVSVMKFVPLPTMNAPSAGVNPATSVSCASYA